MYDDEEKVTLWVFFVSNVETRPLNSGVRLLNCDWRSARQSRIVTGLVAVQSLLTSPSEISISRGELAGKQ